MSHRTGSLLFMSTLDVPGARLYYETRGHGPLLLMIGSPMDSTGFAALAETMSADYTTVTYDPRGLAKSTREDDAADISPELQADDVYRLIQALGGGPVDYLGSSGGATVGLSLVQSHPQAVRTLVAHEPPVLECLPDKAGMKATVGRIQDTYRAQGGMAAMKMFMEFIGMGASFGGGDEPQWQPTPEQLAQMEATNKVFYEHIIHETTGFVPDLDALRAVKLVIGVGATSKEQLAHRTAVALADQLGLAAVEFPGGHGGFAEHPEEFARVLKDALS